MPIPINLIKKGSFYAKDGIRGRTHIREVTYIYNGGRSDSVTKIGYKTHNLVGRENNLPTGEVTEESFARWAEREATSATDVWDKPNQKCSFVVYVDSNGGQITKMVLIAIEKKSWLQSLITGLVAVTKFADIALPPNDIDSLTWKYVGYFPEMGKRWEAVMFES